MTDFHGQARRPDEPHCYNCGGAGHWAIACPEPTRQTPAGLEAWRSSASTPGYSGGGREHRNSQKKSKGPIITKYAPPPPAAPAPGGYPQAPGYPPPPMPGPYAGHPPAPYQPHQQYHPHSAQYPTYPPQLPQPPQPPPNDPRYRFHGQPPHPGPSHSLPPPPPPQHYGPPQPYGAHSAPPGYTGHGAPHPGPPPVPPPSSSLPPPPPPSQAAGPVYPPSFTPYTPHHGPAHQQHSHGYRGQGPPPTPPLTHHNSSQRKHSGPRPSPARSSTSTPSQPVTPKTSLPALPMMHALPPKPPPSAHDRMEHRRDSRNKRKNDKGGRHKGSRDRDHHQRDPSAGKPSANKKKGQQQQGHQAPSKPSDQDLSNLDSGPPQEEHARDEPQSISATRDGDDHDETSKSEEKHDEVQPETATTDSLLESTVDQKADLNSPPHSPERNQDEGPRADQTDGEKPLREQEQLEAPPEPAQHNDRKDLAKASDVDTLAGEEAASTVDAQPKPSSPPKTSYDAETTVKVDAAVPPVIVDSGKDSTPKRSQPDNALKRRRSNEDYRRGSSSPEYSRRQMVTESNLRTLEQSHRRTSNPGLADSGRRDHHGFAASRRRRRSDSEDGSRQRSRRSSISSRSSGLDSLEAELLGRPSKVRSDDTIEPNEKLHEKTSKTKRRRPNVDSAYSRRW